MANILKHNGTSLLAKVLRHPYFPVLVFGCIVFMGHLIVITPGCGDEVWFSNVFSSYNYNPFSYSLMRYYEWTSRTLIELLLMIPIAASEIVWRIMDTIMIIAISVFLSKLLVQEKYRYEGNVVISSLILLFSFKMMSSAGWIATTVNYIWPLAFGLIAIYPLRKIVDGKKIRVYEYVVYTISLLIAANQEQMCFILLVIYGGFTIYIIIKKQRQIFVLVQLGLCLLSLIYIVTCPGNSARVVSETAKWFPEFASFSLLQKAEIGVSIVLSDFFLSKNWLVVVLAFFTCFMVWERQKGIVYRAMAAIPLFSVIVLFALSSFANADHYLFNKLFSAVTAYGIVNSETVFSIKVFLMLFGMLFVYCTLLISIYTLLGNNLKSLVCVGILLVGTATKAIMGFSPTVWASSDRTGLYLMVSLIACTAFLLNQWDFKNKGATQMLFMLTVALGVYGGIINLVAVH